MDFSEKSELQKIISGRQSVPVMQADVFSDEVNLLLKNSPPGVTNAFPADLLDTPESESSLPGDTTSTCTSVSTSTTTTHQQQPQQPPQQQHQPESPTPTPNQNSSPNTDSTTTTNNNNKDSNNTNNCNTANGGEQVTFERNNVIRHKRAKSSLADLLSSDTTLKNKNSNQMLPTPTGKDSFGIIVFVNTHKLRVTISRSCGSVGAVVAVMHHYSASDLQPPLSRDLSYVLRLADDDGSLDDDIPLALEDSVPLSSTGFNTFILLLSEKQTVDEAERLKRRLASKDRMIVRIRLPEGTHQTLEYHPDSTMADILRKVGERGKMDISYYHFCVPASRLPLAPSLSLRAADTDELLLQRKPDAPPLEPTQRTQDDQTEDQEPTYTFFWTEITASQYKEFSVIKINKWGNKQERVMGIDREHITNNLPTKFATTFLGTPKTTLHASRGISQVHTVEQTGPTEFRIVYRDGFDLIPTDYIATTTHDCAEIVSKVKFLKALYAKNKRAK